LSELKQLTPATAKVCSASISIQLRRPRGVRSSLNFRHDIAASRTSKSTNTRHGVGTGSRLVRGSHFGKIAPSRTRLRAGRERRHDKEIDRADVDEEQLLQKLPLF
jgi:hypothetical protein